MLSTQAPDVTIVDTLSPGAVTYPTFSMRRRGECLTTAITSSAAEATVSMPTAAFVLEVAGPVTRGGR
jgi:hypothetical protein